MDRSSANFFNCLCLKIKELNSRRNTTQYLILFYKYLTIMFIVTLLLIILFKIFDFVTLKNQHNLTNLNIKPLLLKDVLKLESKIQRRLAASNLSTKSTQELSASLKLMQNETIIMKKEINEAFFRIGIQIDLCSSDLNLEGPMSVTKMLNNFNLTTLISFHKPKSYDLKTNQYVVEIKHFYLEEKNLNNSNKHPRFDEFWELWHTKNMSILNISKELLGSDGNRVELGGSWRPKDCVSRDKIVIIIPFRDRIPHLRVNLEFMHSLLQKQMLDYRIFVVEGNYPPDMPFNKGRIMNAGVY